MACVASLACATAPAQAAGFLAGAGQADTTPPPAAAAPGQSAVDQQFAPAFATACAAFPNEGRFSLQEPFVDNSSSPNGQWDPGEPYCDANGNGHWDGIYADNGNGPATDVHDPIDVRAIAISDGQHKPVVYASVDQIGIFDYYTEQARADLAQTYHVDADLVVSADHNESSPDSIGLYGALQTPAGVGLRSGIDEYFMSFLEDRIAHAAADAVHDLQPAKLYANQVEGSIPDGWNVDKAHGNRYPLLTGMQQRVSDQFPTANANPTDAPNDDRVAAVDTKLGVLQARRPDGTPIFTVASLAAHNQEMGNSGAGLSADWPGAFEHAFDAGHPGMAIFLVGDNGSEEDPQTDPAVIDGGSENHTDQDTQYIQAQATGQRLAGITARAAADASPLTPGDVTLTRNEICIPLENNGFLALAAAGEFGKRQGYVCDPSGKPVAPVPNGFVAPTVSTQFRTFVGYAQIGPDLQLIDNPGEAFPALMLGSPFGVEDETCDRPNPAVPTWHSNALYRFQVGLADDLVGYLIPAWAFASGQQGLFNNDTCADDMHGRHHKLESESVGPTGSNDVANALAGLLDAAKDPTAHIGPGRFVLADGSYARWPTGAVGILLPPSGSTTLDPAGGTLIGSPTTAGFGSRAVDANGFFMDYDGQPQARPDVTTRGMIVLDPAGCVLARYYLDVFPSLDGSHPLGAAQGGPAVAPTGGCRAQSSGTPGLQATAAAAAHLPSRGCVDRAAPRSVVSGRARLRRGRLSLRGRSSDRGCARRVARVTVTVGKRVGRGRCRFVVPGGRLGRTRSCRRGMPLLAHGRARWRFRMRVRLPHGRYVAIVRAVDTAGNTERARRRGRNVARFRR